jgi:hypothetical protein
MKPDQQIVDQPCLPIKQPRPNKTDRKTGKRPCVKHKSRVDSTTSERFSEGQRKYEPKQELKQQRKKSPFDGIEKNFPETGIFIANDIGKIFESNKMYVGQVEHVVILERYDDPFAQRIIDKSCEKHKCRDKHPS